MKVLSIISCFIVILSCFSIVANAYDPDVIASTIITSTDGISDAENYYNNYLAWDYSDHYYEY